MTTRSYERIINCLRVTFRYHERSKLWSGTIHSRSGRGSLPGGTGYTYQEAEKSTRVLLSRGSAKN